MLSDWDSENQSDLRPINSVVKRLMIASNIQRIDEFIQPGILHFKLRKESKFTSLLFYREPYFYSIASWNRIFENSIDPNKWIINFKHKSQNASLTTEEKQFEDACREIESAVVEIKPRRHGKGSDS